MIKRKRNQKQLPPSTIFKKFTSIMDLVQEQEFDHANNGSLAKLPTIIVKTVVRFSHMLLTGLSRDGVHFTDEPSDLSCETLHRKRVKINRNHTRSVNNRHVRNMIPATQSSWLKHHGMSVMVAITDIIVLTWCCAQFFEVQPNLQWT